MSIYLDLLPPPQFDRSLAAYTVGNFQRIKDALVRASGRVYITSVSGAGGYPVSFTVATPFRSDVLLNFTVSGFNGVVGIAGVNQTLDGGPLTATFLYYFNIASCHQTWSSSVIVRSQAAGNHVWALQAAGGLNADANDKISIGFTFVEV